MQFEIGTIVDGKVIGITKFGAFVEIENGVTGLVHISEISDAYVTDVSDFLKQGDIVKVKVLNVDKNKLSLSIKQVNPQTKTESSSKKDDNFYQNGRSNSYNGKSNSSPNVYKGSKKTKEPQSFEDMLSIFKKNSEEKMSDIKRNIAGKRNSYSRKR